MFINTRSLAAHPLLLSLFFPLSLPLLTHSAPRRRTRHAHSRNLKRGRDRYGYRPPFKARGSARISQGEKEKPLLLF